jgi:hypothetical protein
MNEISSFSVHFSGTNGKPFHYQYLINKAASLGYASLGLSYVNYQTAGSNCGVDVTCLINYFTETISGQDTSPYVQVNRVSKALLKKYYYYPFLFFMAELSFIRQIVFSIDF